MPTIDTLKVVYEVQDQQAQAGFRRMQQSSANVSQQIITANKRAEKSFNGLRTQSRSVARAMEQDMIRSSSRISQALATVSTSIGAFGAAFAVAGGVRSYSRLADAATAMANSLRVAGLEGEELTRVYERLFTSAQRNSTPINALVDLYSKLSLTQSELGVSSEELLSFTDNIAVALKVAGTDATAASGSLLQLSQALGGGVVRAEEFNSILEGTPTIAQAVARGLKEAGGSVAELRKIVIDGELSSQAFFRAFEVGSVELQQQAANSQTTIAQAMTRIGNSLVTVVGDFDQASGASSGLAGIISDLSRGLDRFDAAGFVAEIQGIADAFGRAEKAAANWLQQLANAEVFADLNEVMGITEGGQVINPDVREAEAKINRLERGIEMLQHQIEIDSEIGIENTEAIARLREVRAELAALKSEAANIPQYIGGYRSGPGGIEPIPLEPAAPVSADTGTFINSYEPPPVPVKLVSIADFPAGGTGGGAASVGGSRGGSASPDEFAREVETIKERTQALQAEAEQLVLVATNQKGLGDAIEYARTKAELLTAAQRAGKELTPELRAEIEQLAQSYMTAGLEAEEAADKMREIEEASQRGKDALTDLFGSIFDGSMSAKEAVAQLLAEIAKAQFMKAISSVPGFGGAASFIGNLIPGFAGGGMHAGGLRIVGENGPEVEFTGPSRIMNQQQISRVLAGNRPSQSQSGGEVGVTVYVDDGGNWQAKVEQISGKVSAKVVETSNRNQSDARYLRGG